MALQSSQKNPIAGRGTDGKMEFQICLLRLRVGAQGLSQPVHRAYRAEVEVAGGHIHGILRIRTGTPADFSHAGML